MDVCNAVVLPVQFAVGGDAAGGVFMQSDVSLCHAVSYTCAGTDITAGRFCAVWIFSGVVVSNAWNVGFYADAGSVYLIYLTGNKQNGGSRMDGEAVCMTAESADRSVSNGGKPIVPVIEVKNATVQFNMANQAVNSLKEYLIRLVRGDLMFQEFLALQDVDLTVRAGESWGIIGPNGAGKSTLLKLICGVIKPYRGTVSVNGSIAPLIELGAGFDGELTAKENVMLNGTLMGYSEQFMKKHLDEIIDFADLWDFLDSPMKNYSSGMAARLGFAVATMVQPDILICDEVLAVGDYRFQQKCEERMQHMLDHGTTLLYVSHSDASVRKLCSHALWIAGGRCVMSGSAGQVCRAYLDHSGNSRQL